MGNIEPGQANAKTVSFQVKLDPITVATTWKNGASAVYDNNPDNPTDPKDPKTPVDSNIVEIEGDVPALVIEKSQQKNDEAPATPILVDAGDTITYSLTVSNNGKAAAKDVVVKDPVPEGLELVENSIPATPILVDAGDTITYSLTVSNNGKAAAKDVVVKDPVPEGLELVENSMSDGGTVKDGVITWNLGTLSAGSSKGVTFKVTVPKVTEATTWINAASTIEGRDVQSHCAESHRSHDLDQRSQHNLFQQRRSGRSHSVQRSGIRSRRSASGDRKRTAEGRRRPDQGPDGSQWQRRRDVLRDGD